MSPNGLGSLCRYVLGGLSLQHQQRRGHWPRVSPQQPPQHGDRIPHSFRRRGGGAQVKLPSGHPGAAEVSGDLLHSGQGLGAGFSAFLHKGCTPQNSTFLAPALKLHRMMAPQVYHELLNGTCCPNHLMFSQTSKSRGHCGWFHKLRPCPQLEAPL